MSASQIKSTQNTAIEASPSSSIDPTFAKLIETFSSPQAILIMGLVGLLAMFEYFKGPDKSRGARFATDKQRKRARRRAAKQTMLRFKKPTEVGMVMDNEEKEGFTDLQTSTMFLGAVKTGKTYFGINPMLKSHLDRGDSIVIYDYKYPGQSQNLVGYAQSVGYKPEDIHIFAPSYTESCIFNPVEVATPEYARTVAETLVSNFSKSGENDPFFGPAGIALTEAVLSLSREIGGDIATCQAILSRDNLTARIKSIESTMNPWTAVAFAQFLASAKSEKTASSISGTAALNFDRFVKPHLASAFMGKSTLPLQIEGKKLIILGSRYIYRQSIKPILAVVLQSIIDNNVFFGRKTPLVIALDEFPTLYLSAIVEQIAAVREYGVHFIFGVQNIGQIQLTYGDKEAQALLGCTRTKICYNPNEPETAEYISKMVGNTEIIEKETSKNYAQGKVSRNKSNKRETVRLLPPEDVLGFDTGYRVVFTEAVKGTKSRPLSKALIPLKHRAYIPYITNSPPSKECNAAFDLSKERWSAIQAYYRSIGEQQNVGPEWIGHQIKKVEFLMPDPDESSENQEQDENSQNDEPSPENAFESFANDLLSEEDEPTPSLFEEVA